MGTLRDLSKNNFNAPPDNTSDWLQISCLMRIADASEVMAKNYVQLQNEANHYKREYEKILKRNQELRQELITQRGLVTRYKNKANLFQRVLQRIMNMSPDKGREGCTWGGTEYDSMSAATGYNTALSNVQVEIIKHTKIR